MNSRIICSTDALGICCKIYVASLCVSAGAMSKGPVAFREAASFQWQRRDRRQRWTQNEHELLELMRSNQLVACSTYGEANRQC